MNVTFDVTLPEASQNSLLMMSNVQSTAAKQFADWFRYTYPEEAAEEDRLDRLEGDALREAGSEAPKLRDGVRSRWEKYKKDFAVQQVCFPSEARIIEALSIFFFSLAYAYV